jgi:ABC-2 type transport system permease protein
MLKIYMRLWQVNWAEQWQYRANLMMYMLYDLISPVVYLAVWRSVATAHGDVSGLNANDFTLYYMALLLVGKLTGDITIHILAYKIQDGTLSSELLRPAHPVLTNTLMYNIAFKVLSLIAMVPIWLVLFLLFRPDFSSVSASNLLLGLPAVILGFLLNFLYGATLTSIAFWTTRIYSLAEFMWAFSWIMGGIFVPLELLPAFARQIALLLPFQLSAYFPVQLILGKLDNTQVWQNFLLQGIWLLIFSVAFRQVWRAGLKQYSAVGA